MPGYETHGYEKVRVRNVWKPNYHIPNPNIDLNPNPQLISLTSFLRLSNGREGEMSQGKVQGNVQIFSDHLYSLFIHLYSPKW